MFWSQMGESSGLGQQGSSLAPQQSPSWQRYWQGSSFSCPSSRVTTRILVSEQ